MVVFTRLSLLQCGFPPPYYLTFFKFYRLLKEKSPKPIWNGVFVTSDRSKIKPYFESLDGFESIGIASLITQRNNYPPLPHSNRARIRTFISLKMKK